MHEPASWTYAYLSLSVALSFLWVALYILRHDLDASMLRVSACTALLAITERVFVPRYWNPFTVFNLARRTGFDLESVLFSFAIGGIVFAAYEFFFHIEPVEIKVPERHRGPHRQHTLAVIFPFALFGILVFTTRLNPIYSSAIALVGGFFATLYCRRDLWLKMIVSGGLFFAIYFLAFAVFNVIFPGYVEAVWNLKAISGVRLMGVPLEEMMFGFTFGLYWSSVYEHLTWHAESGLMPALANSKDQRFKKPGISDRNTKINPMNAHHSLRTVPMTYNHFIVPTGKMIRLKGYAPGFTSHYQHKAESSAKFRRVIERLANYQVVLIAQNAYALLIILHAMETPSKNSTIRHVISDVNPQDTQVHSFKARSPEELDYNVLQRSMEAFPRSGGTVYPSKCTNSFVAHPNRKCRVVLSVRTAH